MPNFQSTGRHTETSPEDLSQRCHISVSHDIKKLKHTTLKLLRSAILPLSPRYWSDRMFYRKTLAGKWSKDTIDRRSMTIAGNRYAQVFANDKYFAKLYPKDKKGKAGDALKQICRYFEVPEKLTFDVFKE